jgi:dimethylglycine dehydrogenase
VLVTLKLDEKGPVADADPCGSEPVWDGDKRVGITSSGSYGHRVGARLALAFVERAKAVPGTRLTVELLGERQPATVVATPAVG